MEKNSEILTCVREQLRCAVLSATGAFESLCARCVLTLQLCLVHRDIAQSLDVFWGTNLLSADPMDIISFKLLPLGDGVC